MHRKMIHQSSEDDYASYYVNAEDWSSDRLRKDRNIYANRYNDTSKRFRGFWHLMGQWRGSVIKLIYHELLMFIFLYMTLNMFYRYFLFENAKLCDLDLDPDSWYCSISVTRQWFEYFCVYCGRLVKIFIIEFF